MRGPIDIHQRLIVGDVPHEILHLTRRLSSAADLPDALGVSPASCAIVHVVVADRTPVAVVLPAGSVWSPLALARATGATSVRWADAAETSAATEYSSALVSPLALPETLLVLLDADLAAREVVYTATGQTATAIRLGGPSLAKAANARVGRLAEAAHEAPTSIAPLYERFATSSI